MSNQNLIDFFNNQQETYKTKTATQKEWLKKTGISRTTIDRHLKGGDISWADAIAYHKAFPSDLDAFNIVSDENKKMLYDILDLYFPKVRIKKAKPKAKK